MKFRQWLIQSIITLWSQSCFCHLNCQTCSKLSLLIPHPRLTTCFIISSLAAWISLFPAVCWQFVPVHALFPDLCPSFSLYTNKHGVDVVMLTLRADKCLLNWLCCSSTQGFKRCFWEEGGVCDCLGYLCQSRWCLVIRIPTFREFLCLKTAACLQVVLIITLADRSTNLVNVGFYQLLLINSDSEMEKFGCHRADLFLFSIWMHCCWNGHILTS